MTAAGPGREDPDGTGGRDSPGAGNDLTWPRERSEEVSSYRHFRVRKDWYRSPRDGTEHDFYVLDVPDWVQVVGVTDAGRVILVEQFRPGSRRVTVEFPAGIMDPGESAVDAAVRELAEETGYRGGRASVISRYEPNPALQNNRLHVVLVAGCRPVDGGNQDPGEVIRVREASAEEVESMVATGALDTAYSVVAWDAYRRYRDTA